MNTFTKGPWKAVAKSNPEQSEGTHFIMCPIGALGYWRGSKPYHNDSQWVLGEADANLIASAPDLVEAFELLLYGAEQAKKCGVNQPQLNGGIIMAREAIEKAKGGSK